MYFSQKKERKNVHAKGEDACAADCLPDDGPSFSPLQLLQQDVQGLHATEQQQQLLLLLLLCCSAACVEACCCSCVLLFIACVCRSLQGPGGLTARNASLSALEGAALTLLEGHRLQQPVLRREHPPTYGLKWGPPVLQGSRGPPGDDASPAARFRDAYFSQLRKGAAEDDKGVVVGRHSMHMPSSYYVVGFKPALCIEEDYFNELVGGLAKPQSLTLGGITPENSVVRDALTRMQCLFPSKQLIQDDCGKLIAMVSQFNLS
ncbi:hypothetical protein Emag_004986 [Eimeria magna]